ncbi:MAG: tRNA lysidine(34) synthetase TilS [Candidatus Thiodiazotropha sp.]
MTLNPNRLLTTLKALPAAERCHLALSGGLDSCVLIHLLASLRESLPWSLHAIHINHGLQVVADLWQAHCQSLCEQYQIPLQVVQLSLAPGTGESVEAVAREARYRALAEHVGPGDLLLTAQHQDDQAETLLLQLLRGSGPAGLAAMPPLSRFYGGWLARPLLDTPRATIEAYARHHRLTWQEDPSNRDLRFDRNFIRHRVMPLLTGRWPAAASTLSRAARFSGEMLSLVAEEAEEELARVRLGESGELSVAALSRFESVRLRSLLRHWIAQVGAPMPSSRKLARIEQEAVHGRADALPLIAWSGWEVRRYRDRLRLARALPSFEAANTLTWSDKAELILQEGLGRLVAELGEGGIDVEQWRHARIEIRFRKGGERCIPAGQAHHRPLKKLFQEWGVPPWERQRIPLIYLNDELAAIPGRLVCHPFAAAAGQSSMVIRWEPPFGTSEPLLRNQT